MAISWQSIKERIRGWRNGCMDRLGNGKVTRIVVVLVGLYLIVAVFVGIYWSMTPGEFDVKDNAATVAASHQQSVVVGTTTTATLIHVIETMLNKPGGFISNDILPPGVWLDDIANWEYGVLIQSRDLTRALRESFSRSQSQSKEDLDLGKAEPSLNFSNDSWAVPASESEYKAAIKHLDSYLQRLTVEGNNRSQFYARADNLNYWLGTIETRLGSLSQRLSASVGQRRLSTELTHDYVAQQQGSSPVAWEMKTSWTEIDDVYFESRGTAWALLHFLKAVEVDFADVLAKKNARVSVQQIIRELEATQQTVYSPMILNGSGFGVLANHSLVMASYLSRANAAITDLRDLLSQG